MKKIFLFSACAAVITLACGLQSCNEKETINEPGAELVIVNPPSLQMVQGETYGLQLSVYPDTTLVSRAKWASSDESIVTVDSEGTVTALSAGESEVTATVGTVSSSCKVTVLDVAVESITLSPFELSISKAPGITEQLTATVYPAEAAGVTVKWSSSNDTVAVVDGNGTVTPVGAGEAIITAEAGGKYAHCNVTVEAIYVDKDEINLTVGEFTDIHPLIMSSDPNLTLTGTVSDEDVIYVSYDCTQIRTIGPGEAVLTLSAGDMVTEVPVHVADYTAPEGVGDFIYSDGSRSSELEAGKTPVGIVFWTGDPTAEDPTLARDFPSCTHGLAISLDEFRSAMITNAEQCPYGIYSVNDWFDANPSEDFGPILSTYPYKISGYNNTLGLTAFNADPTNSQWQVEPIPVLEQYRETVPAPENTSGWYIPSFQELILISAGGYNAGDIQDKPYAQISNYAARHLNERLDIAGGTPLYIDEDNTNWYMYQSSSNLAVKVNNGAIHAASVNMSRCSHGAYPLDYQLSYRFVFAF